jgi:hypothetical protein
MTSGASGAANEADGLRMDEKLAEECSNWVAEQLSDEYGGFIAAEMIDAVLEFEVDIRVEHQDHEMDHVSMAGHLLEKLGEEGAPVDNRWGVTPQLLVEILHWEDEFRGLAGQARTVRPSRAQ